MLLLLLLLLSLLLLLLVPPPSYQVGLFVIPHRSGLGLRHERLPRGNHSAQHHQRCHHAFPDHASHKGKL
jgi:hypothetical protein